jgi:hypothetical protein
MIGSRIGAFEIVSLLGEGGPPSLADALTRELPRDLAVAESARTSC